jgi:chitodextrinase
LIDATTAAVNWQPATDDVGVAGYNVYRNGTQIAQLSDTTFDDSGLTPATSYAYSVAAYDAAGNAGLAGPVTSITTPDTVAPSAPANLHATATGSAVALTWPAASDNVGVTGYVVYRNGSRLAGVAALSYTDRSVKQGTTYSYSTAAYDAAGNTSPKSVVRSATVPDTIAPTAPKNLKAVPASRSVALNWTAASDNVRLAGYRLYQGTKLIATISKTSFTVTGLTSGGKYSFHVVAYDATGNVSTASSTVSATAG